MVALHVDPYLAPSADCIAPVHMDGAVNHKTENYGDI